MRCQEAREAVEELESKGNRFQPDVLAHLERCPACQEYRRDWNLVRAGFGALAAEKIPEASVGFRDRLVRQLEDRAASLELASQFCERVGKRFVFAAAALTFMVFLSLLLPSSGPLRGPAMPEFYLSEPQQASLGIEHLFSEGIGDPDPVDLLPASSTGSGGPTQR